MQLDKMVAYHKAMGDPTRLRMLMLLSKQERSGQELAELLHLSQPTITHHAAKLREAALIKERREKNTVYFSLDRYFIENGALASVNAILNRKEGDPMEDSAVLTKNETMRKSVLSNFFAKDGRLKQIPSQLKKKVIVLEYFAQQLEPGRKYEEKEINEFIKRYHEDYATLRRELIMHQFMYRENGIYELNPQTMWTSWQNLR
ncbi:metalloregulator ArsR/SmtB family transcription factor [Paenibacillus caui]|uniref:DUF2087 domain-containing protein n=1 Tax=Paenibacillus caui TaxID=2873927 RepID=UPI001CA9BAEF|nr:metalloregulator ArsR/SmtB family transcription factor [Paenibacillus caui]